MHTPLLRGVQARGPHALGPLGENLRVRISRVDHDLVMQVAEELGMKKAEFCRWCAVEAARQLQSDTLREETIRMQMEEYEKHLRTATSHKK